MTLEDCIEAFRPIAAARNWDTQAGAFQWCGDADEAFSGFMLGYAPNIHCETECFNGLPQDAIDAITLLGHPGLIDDEGTGHVMTRVGNVYIDWTARQFYPDADFPKIWTLDELNASGWYIGVSDATP